MCRGRSRAHRLGSYGQILQRSALVLRDADIVLGQVEGGLHGIDLGLDLQPELVILELALTKRDARLQHLLQDLLQAPGRAPLAGPLRRLGEPQPDIGRFDCDVLDFQIFATAERRLAERAAVGERRFRARHTARVDGACSAIGGLLAVEVHAVGRRAVDTGETLDATDIEFGSDRRVEVERGADQFGHVDQHVVFGIRTDIAGRVASARADVIGIRVPENLDQLVAEIVLLADRGAPQVVDGVLVAPHLAAEFVGIVPDVDRVLQCTHGAIGDLLELGLVEAVELRRIDIKRHHAGGQPKRVQAGVCLVDLGLDGAGMRGDLADLAQRVALDALYALGQRVGLLHRHDGIDRQPVEVGAHAGAPAPLGQAPGTFGIGVGIALPLAGGIFDIARAVGQVDQFCAGARLGRSGLGELAFVEKVHGDRHAGDLHGFGPRLPGEERMQQQVVIDSHAGQVMTPGVAVALRELDARVELVEHAVVVDVVDVVALRIGHLPVAGGEVPEQPVVDRPGRDRAVGCVATAQQHQLFFQQRGQLVLEVEDTRRKREAAVAGGDADGRVLRVGKGLVAQQGIEIDDARSHQQDGVVGRTEVHRRRAVHRKLHGAAHDRGVGLDQADIVQIVRVVVERDRPLESLAELNQHAGEVVGRGLAEVLHPGLERVEPVEHALDPAFGQLRQLIQGIAAGRAGEAAPESLVVAAGQAAIARQVPVVRKRPDVGALDADLHRALRVVQRHLDPAVENAVFRVRGRRLYAAGVGSEEPLEFQRVRIAAEVAAVAQHELLVEDVLRLEHVDLAVQRIRPRRAARRGQDLAAHIDDLQAHRQRAQCGVVVERQSQLAAALGESGG